MDVIMIDSDDAVDISSIVPREVWHKILSFLDIPSCVQLSETSKMFHTVICSDDAFWRSEYYIRNSNTSSSIVQSLLEGPFDAEFRPPGPYDSDSHTGFWKQLAFTRKRFEELWSGSETYLQEQDAMFTAKAGDKAEISSMFSTVDPFTRDINSCALGMTDGNIYIWDTRRKECSVTFENAHQDGILDVRVFNQPDQNSYNVISGSKDGVIKIWNIDSGNLIHQHNLAVPKQRRVRGMFFPRGGLSEPAHFFQPLMERSAFVSYDHLINHVDLETGKVYSVFGEAADDGPGWVTCFSCISPSLIATAGSSRKVSLWDLRSPEKPVSTISDQHKEWIRCLQLHGWNHALATGSSDAMVRIFDLRKQSVLVSSFGPHAGSKQRPGRVNSLQMDFDKIICAAKRTIYAYDQHTERRLFFKTPLPSGKYTDWELKFVQFYDEQVIASFTTDDRVEVQLFRVRKKSSDDMDVDDISIADVPRETSKFRRLRKGV